MEERVREVLHKLGYTDDEIHLEAAGDSVGGYIVSEAFRGESQINRQSQLWRKLEEHMQADELIRISAILTMTPAEVAP